MNDKYNWDASTEQGAKGDMAKAKAIADVKGSAPGGDSCLKVEPPSWAKVKGPTAGRGK